MNHYASLIWKTVFLNGLDQHIPNQLLLVTHDNIPERLLRMGGHKTVGGDNNYLIVIKLLKIRANLSFS